MKCVKVRSVCCNVISSFYELLGFTNSSTGLGSGVGGFGPTLSAALISFGLLCLKTMPLKPSISDYSFSLI